MKDSRKNLVAAQKSCFKQVFKYEAGMICAACNGNYGKFITKNGDGSFTMKVKKDTCARLQKACYKYLVERNTAAKYMQDQAKVKKARSSKEKVKGHSKNGTKNAVIPTKVAPRMKSPKSITRSWLNQPKLKSCQKKK